MFSELSQIATVFSVAIFSLISCNSNHNLKDIGLTKNYPSGITKNFKIIYTASAKVQMIIESPLHEDYSNKAFPYNNFPNGIQIELFDTKNGKTTITANSARIYQSSNIIELKGDVVMHAGDGKILETSKIYWNQNTNWIFTEEEFAFTNPQDGTIMYGVGIDFSKDFNNLIAHKINGKVSISQAEEDN